MSAVVKGKQIIWGVVSGAVTIAAAAATAAGIVESFTITRGGAEEKIGDEDGDIVTRVDHGAENKIEMTVMCVATTAAPAKGTEISGLTSFEGVNFSVGRTFVDDSKVVFSAKDAKKISISATHYPGMAADA